MITFKQVTGNPNTYEITVTTCTKLSSESADRDTLEINWGHGSLESIPRTSKETISDITDFDLRINTYVKVHTYPSPGTYEISILDPNRNAGIINIENSVDQPFCIKTVLKINPALGNNSSPIIEDCPCPEVACVKKPYCLNIGATDPDGTDSIAYEITLPSGRDCNPLRLGVRYLFPNAPVSSGVTSLGGGGGTLSLDPITGTLCWDAPQLVGEFNLAILIKEYRKGFLISSIVTDIQITVANGPCLNDPPIIDDLPDTCIVAGSTLQFDVTATDPDSGPGNIKLVGIGDPFNVNNPATFSQNPALGFVAQSFQWQTNCSHTREKPYQVFFVANDDDGNSTLKDIETMTIKVVAPPPVNLTAVAQNNSMLLNWSSGFCATVDSTEVLGYNIYRIMDSVTLDISCCENNVAQKMGFELIGSTSATDTTAANTSFLDISEKVPGQVYCYVVTARLSNGSESCVSNKACSELTMSFPLITNASVISTDVITGQDTIIWVMPKEDTSNFIGPFYYQLFRGNNFSFPNQLIYTSPSSSFIALTDTIFLDQNTNTNDLPHNYRVELYGDSSLIGFTNQASTIFLSVEGNDNRVDLSWNEKVPWTNSSYEIWKETPLSSGNFSFVNSTTEQFYSDTGLVNGTTHCYKVRSIGSYPTIDSALYPVPLLNWSQEVCASSIDKTPPCPPVLNLVTSCDDSLNTLTWTNPNNSCADDVMSYTLYFRPSNEEPMELLQVIDNPNNTSFSHVMDYVSIAGCYIVTATDSVQYGNESDSSNLVCIDNCPFYLLPNIFTPNNDGKNDFFRPIGYQSIDYIEIEIYNRWGKLVYRTNDININWDGTNFKNGSQQKEGVYFYICKINARRLSGPTTETIKGTIHLLRGGNNKIKG